MTNGVAMLAKPSRSNGVFGRFRASWESRASIDAERPEETSRLFGV